jgi:hypothetical protein
MNQSFDWEAYFSSRIIKLNELKRRVNYHSGYLSQLEKTKLIQYEQEMKEENIKWDLVLADICKIFDTDIEDVRTFISPNSSIFKITKEELVLKHKKLIDWVKDLHTLKNLIASSELGSCRTGIENGIWRFNKDIDLISRFDEVKKYLRISSYDFFELAKIDATYFMSIFNENQYLERKISVLASTIDLKIDEFIEILHNHPYLIHLYPKKINFNLEWMCACFKCKRIELVRLMHQYPPIMFWTVSSLGDIFKLIGYSFSSQNQNFNTFKKVVFEFFDKGFY